MEMRNALLNASTLHTRVYIYSSHLRGGRSTNADGRVRACACI